jgi:hypothetical protein
MLKYKQGKYIRGKKWFLIREFNFVLHIEEALTIEHVYFVSLYCVSFKNIFCFPLFLGICDVFHVHYEVSVPGTKYVRSLYGDSQQAEPS